MNIPQQFDNLLDAIQAVLMSFLVKLGPFFVALMPALFTGYSVFYIFQDKAGRPLALFFALVVGLAMETVGIVATHTAIELYNGWQREFIQPVKFWAMIALVPFYVIGVAAVVYYAGDAFSDLVRALGIASPFLTVVVYVAVALARDLSNIEARHNLELDRQDEIEADDKTWQREKERLEIELRHKEKLARIEAKATVQSTVQKSPNLVQGNVQSFDYMSKDERLNALLTLYLDNPNAQIGQAMDALGVSSRQTIYNYQTELEESGRLHKNGNGWVVTK